MSALTPLAVSWLQAQQENSSPINKPFIESMQTENVVKRSEASKVIGSAMADTEALYNRACKRAKKNKSGASKKIRDNYLKLHSALAEQLVATS